MTTLTWTDTALVRLRDASGRSGGARRRVVEVLGQQDCCLSAQEIHDAVRAQGRRVGIASVYRALEGMDELGLVQRVDLGDGVARFEPAHSGGDHHHHLVCDDCGKVEPFEDASLESAIERVAEGRGYSVAAHDVVLRGACEDCRHDRD
jgi:Fur family ferric uptake transcriptional regulator